MRVVDECVADRWRPQVNVKKKVSQKVPSSLPSLYKLRTKAASHPPHRSPWRDIFCTILIFDGIWSSTQNSLSVSQIYFWFDINNAFSPDTEKSSPPAAWGVGVGGGQGEHKPSTWFPLSRGTFPEAQQNNRKLSYTKKKNKNKIITYQGWYFTIINLCPF